MQGHSFKISGTQSIHVGMEYGAAAQRKDKNIMYHMYFAYCITKANNTHSEYDKLIALQPHTMSSMRLIFTFTCIQLSYEPREFYRTLNHNV